MKKTLFLLFFIAAFGAVKPSEALARPGVNFGIFYSSLSPYGTWVDCNLGYVWRPLHMSHGWRPYLDGRWVWSDYGWYWVSAEPFGWATYHYGRWYYDDYYGWVWIPDETWGPAWVEWRYNDDYIGWAPLTPYATFGVSFGVRYSHPWSSPAHYWNFVTYHNFTSDRINEAVQPVERNARIFGGTRGMVDIAVRDNRIMNRGVDAGVIERRGNIRIRTADIIERSSGSGEQVSRVGNRDRIEAYRPKLEARLREDFTRPQNVERANKPIATDFDRSVREKRRDRIRSIEGDTHSSFGPRRNQPNVPDNRRGTDRSTIERKAPQPRFQPAPRGNAVPRGKIERPNTNRPPRTPQYIHPRPNNQNPPGVKGKPPERIVPKQQGRDHGGFQPRERRQR